MCVSWFLMWLWQEPPGPSPRDPQPHALQGLQHLGLAVPSNTQGALTAVVDQLWPATMDFCLHVDFSDTIIA